MKKIILLAILAITVQWGSTAFADSIWPWVGPKAPPPPPFMSNTFDLYTSTNPSLENSFLLDQRYKTDIDAVKQDLLDTFDMEKATVQWPSNIILSQDTSYQDSFGGPKNNAQQPNAPSQQQQQTPVQQTIPQISY